MIYIEQTIPDITFTKNEAELIISTTSTAPNLYCKLTVIIGLPSPETVVFKKPFVATLATFNCQAIIGAILKSSNDMPVDIDTPLIVLLEKTACTVTYFVEEIIDNDSVNDITISGKISVSGGIEQELYDQRLFLNDGDAALERFLTYNNKNLKKRIGLDDLIVLTLCNFVSGTTISGNKIEITAYDFSDSVVLGTSDLISGVLYTADAMQFHRIVINGTAVKLKDLLIGLEVNYVEISITGISEVRTYYIDYENYLYNNEFVFANSVGGVDTINIHSPIEFGIDIDFDINNVPVTSNGMLQQKNKRVNSNTRTMKLTHTSTTEYESLLMQELLNSESVWHYKNGKMLPVVITNKSETVFKDGEAAMFFDLEMTYSKIQKVFTAK